MRHNYPALSPLDLERLCADLLGAEFGMRFETFAARRDGGIDLRCHTDDGLVIGQAKHYQDRAALIRTMRTMRTEKDKLAQFWPARYLLLTSCALTPANKDTLLEILAPYCRSSADVYGRDELDVALARHPAVLWRHFKLWLQDATQLSSILHNRLHQLSRARQAEHKRAIADPRGYGQIISHAHFNPRLLKRLLDDGRQQPAADFSSWLHAQLRAGRFEDMRGEWAYVAGLVAAYLVEDRENAAFAA